jgi:hypothetical protein
MRTGRERRGGPAVCAGPPHTKTLDIMKGLWLLALVGCAGAANAAERQAVRIDSISQIPTPIVQALTALCTPCVFADIGAPWNPGDVIVSDLPQRRLVRVEQRGSEWFIEYEHGGRGQHSHLAVFSTVPTVHYVRGSCNPLESRKCEW